MVSATDDELKLLKKAADAICPLTEDDWSAFSAGWQKMSVGRNQTLTIAGNIEQHLYFVVDGVQRIFYLDECDREATLVFTYAPSFGGVIDSLLLQQPSRYYYETLSHSVLLTLSYDKLSKLINERKSVTRLVTKALTISLSGLLQRLVELQAFTSEEKFRKLLQRSPHILQLVPQKYLANYIGMDATNFSKLINRIRI